MRCYILTHKRKEGWYAEVTSEQDYFECGPWAYSFRSGFFSDPWLALNEARDWCSKNGMVESEKFP